MASILLIAFGVLAFVHWLYEDVIAPSLRDWLRYQLFELRDRLRTLKVKNEAELSDDLYLYLQRSLNNTLKYLRLVNVSFIWKAIDIAKETSLNPAIAHNEALLEQCENEQIRDIRKRQLDLIGYILITNMGGWIIYLIPVLMLMVVFKQIKQTAKVMLYMPEQDMLRVVTDSSVPATRMAHV